MEETEIEIDILEEGHGFVVAEGLVRDIADELEELHYRSGSHFIYQLKVIASHPSFYPVKDEINIFTTGGEGGEDFDNLLNAARKAVEHGYKVFILPNPKGIRTADFIFERKGVYKMFDLKTISGKSSLGNRLMESIGQTNHVLINVCTKYNPRLMATQIRSYFQANPDAIEVIIYKGKKEIVVTRRMSENSLFLIHFQRKFAK